jgi:hypothetical protein
MLRHCTLSFASGAAESGLSVEDATSRSTDLAQGLGTSDPIEEELLELGSFGSPHGVRGHIKFYAVTDSPEERLSSQSPR